MNGRKVFSLNEQVIARLVRARSVALVIVLLGGVAYFGNLVHEFYPIHSWLFWRYAGYWLATLYFMAACWAAGHALLRRFLTGALRKSEELALALPLGVLAFGLAIFFLGLVHALHSITFLLLPAAFLAAGGRGLLRDVKRFRERLERMPRRPRSLWWIPIGIFAVLAIGLIYIQILSPDTLGFDSRWYHLPLAQRYALSGAVTKSVEGYWNFAWPHLMSYLYAWAFLAPGTLLFDRIEICMHLEFALFVATLPQIPVLVRRLVPRAHAGFTWAVMLLFPSIYAYDGNLNGGADHVAAVFAVPIALTFVHAWRHFRPMIVLLFTAFAGAAALTKYTALSVVLPPAIALFLRGLWLFPKSPTTRAALGTLVAGSLAFTAPHWLKNIIWYGDPIYPMLHKYLDVDPWTPETEWRLKLLHNTSRPGELTKDGLLEALKTTVTYSFKPNDWWIFHRDVPIFGSLFTLTTPCLLFVRGGLRVAWLNAMTMAAIFVWFLISHYDRYLQVALPWMAAATAACLVLIWRSGQYARGAAALLLGLQLVWGGDVPFLRTHNQLGDSPIRRVAQFLASGFEQVSGRLKVYEPLTSVGREIPKDAVVLAHDTAMILGIDRNWVSDIGQSRISYGVLRSPAAIHQELRDLGVTHLVWPGSSARGDTLAGDLAFFNYAKHHTLNQKRVGDYTIATLPPRAPKEARKDYDVALFGCRRPYAKGWYRLSQLTLPTVEAGRPPKPLRPLENLDSALSDADFIVVEGCNKKVDPSPRFVQVLTRDESRLYVRVEGMRPADAP